jgi:hypothetical protein
VSFSAARLQVASAVKRILYVQSFQRRKNLPVMLHKQAVVGGQQRLHITGQLCKPLT